MLSYTKCNGCKRGLCKHSKRKCMHWTSELILVFKYCKDTFRWYKLICNLYGMTTCSSSAKSVPVFHYIDLFRIKSESKHFFLLILHNTRCCKCRRKLGTT